MRVFLTGATGFIGSAVCKGLVDAGHDVMIAVRDSTHWRLAEFIDRTNVLEADLSQSETYRQALNSFQPDGVVHLAWAGVSGADRNSHTQIANIGWTTDLVYQASDAGASIFVGVGSQAEYGAKSDVILTDDKTEPTTLYGESKLAACRLSQKICAERSMRFAWARVFSTYGPGDHPHWMIPTLIHKLMLAERPALTQGAQMWDFLHVRDAASAIRCILEAPEGVGIFNLGSGHAPSLKSTIECVRDCINTDLELGWGDIPYRPDQVMILQADTSRLAALGWAPKIDLREGLRETVKWYCDNSWIYEQE